MIPYYKRSYIRGRRWRSGSRSSDRTFVRPPVEKKNRIVNINDDNRDMYDKVTIFTIGTYLFYMQMDGLLYFGIKAIKYLENKIHYMGKIKNTERNFFGCSTIPPNLTILSTTNRDFCLQNMFLWYQQNFYSTGVTEKILEQANTYNQTNTQQYIAVSFLNQICLQYEINSSNFKSSTVTDIPWPDNLEVDEKPNSMNINELFWKVVQIVLVKSPFVANWKDYVGNMNQCIPGRLLPSSKYVLNPDVIISPPVAAAAQPRRPPFPSGIDDMYSQEEFQISHNSEIPYQLQAQLSPFPSVQANGGWSNFKSSSLPRNRVEPSKKTNVNETIDNYMTVIPSDAQILKMANNIIYSLMLSYTDSIISKNQIFTLLRRDENNKVVVSYEKLPENTPINHKKALEMIAEIGNGRSQVLEDNVNSTYPQFAEAVINKIYKLVRENCIPPPEEEDND